MFRPLAVILSVAAALTGCRGGAGPVPQNAGDLAAAPVSDILGTDWGSFSNPIVCTPVTPVTEEGACCDDGLTCREQGREGCRGTWFAGERCPTPRCRPDAVGACCLPDGGCDGLSMDDFGAGGQFKECASVGGVYLGGGTSCLDLACPGRAAEPVACCRSGHPCTTTSRQACLLRGGLALDSASECASRGCDPPRAAPCCLPEGDCDVTSAADCRGRDGIPWPPDDHTPPWERICRAAGCGSGSGGCCLPDGTCEPMGSAAACAARGGAMPAYGLGCDLGACAALGSPGACCAEDGYCLETFEALCDGSFSLCGHCPLTGCGQGSGPAVH